MKNVIKLLCVVILAAIPLVCYACMKKQAAENLPVSVLQKTEGTNMVTTTDESKNDFWVCTFQLIWNDLMDKIVKGPVNFVGGNPKLADILNKQSFTEDMLSPDSYYKVLDTPSKALKAKIENDIYEKFEEKSDILDRFDWPDAPVPGSFFLYTMLIKKFEFEPEFSELDALPFNGSANRYKFFGIDKNSEFLPRLNVKVLFYNSENEYAVMLKNTQNEEVILYRTDADKSLDELYKNLTKKSEKNEIKFGYDDNLRVPFIAVDKEVTYDSLCDKQIKNTNFIISQAIQTVKFNMDNKCGKLKSEAAMTVKSSAMITPPVIRNYYFDKKFVLFMKEENKPKPYFALKVKNTDFLVPEK